MLSQNAADRCRKLSCSKRGRYTDYQLTRVLEIEEQCEKTKEKRLSSFCTGAECPKSIWNFAKYSRKLLLLSFLHVHSPAASEDFLPIQL